MERLTGFLAYVEGNAERHQRRFGLSELTAMRNKQSLAIGPRLSAGNITLTESSVANGLAIRSLTLQTPDSRCRCLLQDLTLSLKHGDRLLVVGPSGVGKTSLLRAIAGLCSTGSGSITRRPIAEAFFMPQRPYCVFGTLRDQLTYLHDSHMAQNRVFFSDYALERALAAVGLLNLATRMGGFDTTRNWSDVLSVGETQRLAFARLNLCSPKLIIIDEGTSALDLATERKLMSTLRDHNAVLVSVGHRPSLLQYHHKVLSIREDGGCSLHPAKSFDYYAHS